MNINVTGFPFDANFSNTSNFKNVLYDIVTQDPPMLNITLHDGPSSHHAITSFIEKYIIPVISIVGLIGNTISSVVFLRKSLRNSSCSIFLAARGFSDNGFLSTLLIIWISRTFQLHLGKIRNSCQIIIFLTYVCGCASVWLVVFVTIENYIRICRPFIVNRICTTRIAKIIVGLLSFVTVCIYNFPFWAMSPDYCIPYVRYHNTVQALVYTDTLLTLVVPLICMTLVMTAITCSLIKSYNRRNRLRAPTAKRIKNPMAKVTKMLFAVSMTFICLNLPSHINRLRIMISSLLNKTEQRGNNLSWEAAIQQITLLVYYLSLATNLIVYVTFGSKFRKVLREILNIPKARTRSADKSKDEKDQELTPIINETKNLENQSNRTEIVPLQ